MTHPSALPRESTIATVPAASPLDYARTALAQESFELAATTVASELARNFECDHVVVGMVTKHHAIKPVGWSGVGDLRGEYRLVRGVAAAMNEALDQQASLRFPPDPKHVPRITLMHAELVSIGLCAAALSVPLVARRRIVGMLTLLRTHSDAWSNEELTQLERAAAVVGPILDLKRSSEASALKRLSRDARAAMRTLTERGHLATKLLAAAVLMVSIAVCAVPVTVNVAATARLEGVVQRSVAAPADTYVREVFVRPGDVVEKDQVLLNLADDDLRTEQRRLQSELARYSGEHAEAFALQDRAKMVIAEARADEAAAALAIVEQQIARTQVLAPFAGIVIKGDLQQQVGAPVKRGDVLLVLAPSADYRIVLDVEDSDIDQLRAGMPGRLTLSAMPYQALDIRVDRITPIARLADGQNVFEVHARLSTPVEGLRPGLEGVAKLPVDQAPLVVTLASRVAEWLRFKVWSWLG